MKLVALKDYLRALLKLGWRVERRKSHYMAFHPNGRAKVLVDANEQNFSKQGFYKQMNYLKHQGVMEELLLTMGVK